MIESKHKGLITPDIRMHFERNTAFVIEDMYRKLDTNQGLGSLAAFTWPHLKKLKLLPNGRVNLLTIDESLRLQGNMLFNMPLMDWAESEQES